MLESIIKIFKAFKYSMEGLWSLRKERSFVQELLLVIVLLPIFFIFSFSYIELIVLISSLLFVLIIEIINSAIEATIDRISTKKHPLSKKIKDLGSAIVLLSFINLAIVWGIVLYRKLI